MNDERKLKDLSDDLGKQIIDVCNIYEKRLVSLHKIDGNEARRVVLHALMISMSSAVKAFVPQLDKKRWLEFFNQNFLTWFMEDEEG